MTRSNLDRWEDCGEAPQGTSLAQLRSNVLYLILRTERIFNSHRGFTRGAYREIQGNERTELRETLQSFAPSLPMFGAGKLRGKLSAAQSSIQSLLDAQEQREQLERQLRTSPESSRREVRG